MSAHRRNVWYLLVVLVVAALLLFGLNRSQSRERDRVGCNPSSEFTADAC